MIQICRPLTPHKVINGYCINCGGVGGTPGPCDIIPDKLPKAKPAKVKPIERDMSLEDAKEQLGKGVKLELNPYPDGFEYKTDYETYREGPTREWIKSVIKSGNQKIDEMIAAGELWSDKEINEFGDIKATMSSSKSEIAARKTAWENLNSNGAGWWDLYHKVYSSQFKSVYQEIPAKFKQGGKPTFDSPHLNAPHREMAAFYRTMGLNDIASGGKMVNGKLVRDKSLVPASAVHPYMRKLQGAVKKFKKNNPPKSYGMPGKTSDYK